MKTQEEIVKHIEEIKDEDFFGFMTGVLVYHLDFEHAKPYLKEDVEADDWTPDSLDHNEVINQMAEYMEFAWDKARNHRGLSSGRSVQKMQAWLWLLGDDETIAFAKDDSNYPSYGAPILKKICEKYDFPIPEGEDVVNMGGGRPCSDDCCEGCT